MDKEETTAPIPEEEKGGGDGGYGECVPHDGGEQFEIWTPLSERTISEKKRTDRKTFLGRTAEETTRTTTKQY